MKSALLSLASVAVYVATSLGQQLTINTPSNVAQCEPSLLSWSGGSPPYFVTVTPGASPDSAALATLVSNSTATSFTWNVPYQAGTSLDLTVRDGVGAIAQTAPFTVLTGTTGCSTSSAPAGGSPSTTSSSSSTSGGSSATTPGATSTGSSSSSASSTGSSSSSSSSPTAAKSSAAKGMGVEYGFAGVVGIIAAALLS